MRSLASALLFSIVGLLFGCTATETGNPSAVPSPVDFTPVSFASDSVNAYLPVATPTPDPPPPSVYVEVQPGTIDPPTGEALVWNLDTADPVVRGDVKDDGSFSLEVPSVVGQLLRLQLRRGDAVSAPFDFRVSAVDYMPEPIANPCLMLEPSGVAGVLAEQGAFIEISGTNQCDEPVTRTAARLRASSPDFAVTDMSPLTTAPGSSFTIQVEVLSAAATAEDILLLAIDSPSAETRAINVIARAAPVSP